MNLQTIDSTPALDQVATSGSIFGREFRPCWSVIIVSGALFVSGTSSSEPYRLWEAPYFPDDDATASGDGWVDPGSERSERPYEAPREALSELRRISGLTWEQLARLFSVSRRSVHFWASGERLSAKSEEHLRRVLDVVRTADRGDARSTRSALLDVHDGISAFDLLVKERYDEARARLGVGQGRPRRVLVALSADAKAARAPLRPDELVEAHHDRVHRDPGRARPARIVRKPRRGTS